MGLIHSVFVNTLYCILASGMHTRQKASKRCCSLQQGWYRLQGTSGAALIPWEALSKYGQLAPVGQTLLDLRSALMGSKKFSPQGKKSVARFKQSLLAAKVAENKPGEFEAALVGCSQKIWEKYQSVCKQHYACRQVHDFALSCGRCCQPNLVW